MNADLEFTDWANEVLPKWGSEEWVTVYSNSNEHLKADGGTFSALIPNEIVPHVKEDYQWDLRKGMGGPTIITTYENGKSSEKYHRTDGNGIEPLVILRTFSGTRPSYLELSQEFVLYFDLCRETLPNKENFIVFDEAGDEEVVAVIKGEDVKIKLRFIKEYLAVKEMHLALYFDLRRSSKKTIQELKLQPKNERIDLDENIFYNFFLGPERFGIRDSKTFGMIMGKKLIPPPSPDFRAMEIDNEYEEFIVGVDENGKEKSFTCSRDILNKQKVEPFFLTPIYFRREVLQKYYNSPEQYEIQDGYIRRKGFWGLKVDNNHSDYVIVFLGDLSALPYKEQKYWKGFNVSVSDSGMSKTHFDRMIHGKFSPPSAVDLFFKAQFKSFNEKWEERFGWKLWSDLKPADQHNFDSLRVPLQENSQKEFDELVGSIVKVFIDSLNEADIGKFLSEKGIDIKNKKGLDKIQEFFYYHGLRSDGMINFFRKLQDLRSRGVAHLKGKKYERLKSEFSIDEIPLKQVFEEKILVGCIWSMNTLDGFFKLGVKKEYLDE